MTDAAGPQNTPVVGGEGMFYGSTPWHLGALAWHRDEICGSTSFGRGFAFR
jgi:hypothetical protein